MGFSASGFALAGCGGASTGILASGFFGLILEAGGLACLEGASLVGFGAVLAPFIAAINLSAISCSTVLEWLLACTLNCLARTSITSALLTPRILLISWTLTFGAVTVRSFLSIGYSGFQLYHPGSLFSTFVETSGLSRLRLGTSCSGKHRQTALEGAVCCRWKNGDHHWRSGAAFHSGPDAGGSECIVLRVDPSNEISG